MVCLSHSTVCFLFLGDTQTAGEQQLLIGQIEHSSKPEIQHDRRGQLFLSMRPSWLEEGRVARCHIAHRPWSLFFLSGDHRS